MPKFTVVSKYKNPDLYVLKLKNAIELLEEELYELGIKLRESDRGIEGYSSSFKLFMARRGSRC